LEGSSWQVLSYNNGKEAVVSVIIGTEITANFDEDGQLIGNAGCNNYSAQYEAQGENISIETAELTEMACLEPEGIMEQEQLYLAALETADTYKIEGVTMDMRTSEGSRVATFQRALNP
jgi:heat shock protein HslJ